MERFLEGFLDFFQFNRHFDRFIDWLCQLCRRS